MALGSHNEIGRDQLRPLVQKLIERMLSVGCRLAEQDCASAVFDIVSTPGNRLTVRLH